MKFTTLDPQFAVSPQIQVSDIGEIAALGFTGIINNRPDGEEIGQPTSSELEAEANRNGLWFLHIPVMPGVLTDEDVHRLNTALRNSEGLILAFCRSGTRSTNLWKAAQRIT